MAYASAIMASPAIRLPSVAMPNLRRLRLSRRARALLMMAILCSPTFLADDIGYGVERLFKTADQIAESGHPTRCSRALVSSRSPVPRRTCRWRSRQRWTAEAALDGWPQYPEAGTGCFKPERNLYGIVGLKVFGVACPTAILSVADQRRWVAYAANHDWAALPASRRGLRRSVMSFRPDAVAHTSPSGRLRCYLHVRQVDASMAEAKTKKSLISHGVAAQNRKARFDYAIKDTVEAGLVLKGPEVKSLRHGRATLTEAWAGERDGELWLFNAYIPEYQGGVLSRFEPRAPRKLLLKRKQIRSLAGAVARDGVSLVPLQIHFNERGQAKVLLGLGEGRKKQDKRAAIAARDWQRDKARLMRARG